MASLDTDASYQKLERQINNENVTMKVPEHPHFVVHRSELRSDTENHPQGR